MSDRNNNMRNNKQENINIDGQGQMDSGNGEIIEVFGDQPMLLATMFVLLLHVLHNIMLPNCTC